MANGELSTKGRPAVYTTAAAALALSLAVLSTAPTPAEAWGTTSSSSMEYFSTSQRRDYLYNSKKINLEYVGCGVGYTRVNGDKEDEGGEGGGCLDNSSEDGLSYWFMMSNCKRAQVVFNVFAGSSLGGCSEGTFQESVSFRIVAESVRLRGVGPRTHSTSCALLCCHCRKADLTPFTTLTPLPSLHLYVSTCPSLKQIMTRGGISEFAATMAAYDQYSPLSQDVTYDLPQCEYDGDSGYYLDVGCGTNGQFTIERFSDPYCLSHEDTLYALDDINSALKKLKSCHTAYDSSSGNNAYNSLAGNLIPLGATCTSVDSQLCTNFAGFSTSGVPRRSRSSGQSASLANKFKYVLGSILLAASVMMFLGILFTNRRRRRAMMHRKFRQAAARKKRSGSRSKSRSGHRSRSRGGRESSRARSKSKSRSQSKSRSDRDDNGTGGVLT